MPGALTWDPDREGGAQTTFRGAQNPGQSDGLPLVSTSLTPLEQAIAANALAITAAGAVVRAAADRLSWASVSGDGVPAAFTSRALTAADDGYTLVCASSQTATVNTGLASGFGCAFKGAISFAGTATVTDVRTAGAANPWCALVQTGADTYDAVGSKA